MAAPTTPERNSRIEWLLEQLIAKVEEGGAPGTVMKYGGRVDTVDDLPATGLPNQYYFVGPVTSTDFQEYVWAEPTAGSGHWDLLGAVTITVDLVLDITSNNPIANSAVTAALNGKQDALTFDNAPTESSDNPVKSGGIYTALGTKMTVHDNYIETGNGDRLYISSTAPTGTIPEGSVGVGW